jgi:magnesium-transporting ATPase (P-type)
MSSARSGSARWVSWPRGHEDRLIYWGPVTNLIFVDLVSPDTADITRKIHAIIPSGTKRTTSTKTVVVHGSSIPNMSEDDWKVLVSKQQEIVFARTSPAQKLTIVKEFT